jgi:heme/copper-type cytochrome/quinol oxidase subunit 2
MSGIRRATHQWRGAIVVAAALMSQRTAAADQPVHEVQIVASKYTFEPSTIQVTAGEPVRLVLRSKNGTHGFSVPKLKIDERIPKTGDPVTVEFTAPPAGHYEIACSEFCGFGHSHMKAELISVTPVTTSR